MPLVLTATKATLLCDVCGQTYRLGVRANIANENEVGTFKTSKPSMCKACRNAEYYKSGKPQKQYARSRAMPKPKGMSIR
jgi:hypothetical protein